MAEGNLSVVLDFSPGECTDDILENAPIGSIVDAGDFGTFHKRLPLGNSCPWTRIENNLMVGTRAIAAHAVSIKFPTFITSPTTQAWVDYLGGA